MMNTLRDKLSEFVLRRHIEGLRPLSKGEARTRLAVTAAALVFGVGNAAFAQAAGGDILGVTPVETAFIGFLDIVAIMGVGYGFMRLMSGRHTLEGLMCMGIGVLGIAKAPAIATFLGA